MSSIDASLKRLGTDYVDLYQIHRWDHETPIEETMETLHDIVRAGKVRYIALRRCSPGKKFVLAQLHQLRGRVGRSHHQAYANLLVQDEKALT